MLSKPRRLGGASRVSWCAVPTAIMRGSIPLILVSLLSGWCAAVVAAEPTTAGGNRLAHERSLYLRQHAHNPVDWYPWGPEAFDRARRENKPIFLSIGYSTCHWCHVMERESFADPDIARLLNEHFVSIKVDREERPDVDRVHLMFVQASTGHGGWPLNVWLTPDLKPFFGGTYFGPVARPGHPSFRSVLQRLARLWAEQPERVVEQAAQMQQALAQDLIVAGNDEVPIAALRERALRAVEAAYDPVHGGFTAGEKFPDPSIHAFLLDLAVTAPSAEMRTLARRLSLTTLHAMAAGGLHDQLGGGFHRYSVDPGWRVPHFEKMLYDQAQLANVYLTAWQLTREPRLREVAVGILHYVHGNLQHPSGGFYAAEDAESGEASAAPVPSDRPVSSSDETRATLPAEPRQKREGAYYVWTWAEIEQALGREDAAWLAPRLGLAPAGNIAAAVAPDLVGYNVPYRPSIESDAAAEARFAALTGKLGAVRAQRPRPARDNTIITAWNGLMISALARAAEVLEEPHWAESAVRAAAFVRAELRDPASGRLARSIRQGQRSGDAFAEDYAFLIQGLIDLYQATHDLQWLEWADQLQSEQDRLFRDPEHGGYFATTAVDASVVLRIKEAHDGPEPAATSIAVRNLVRLSGLLHDDARLERARQCVRAFGPSLEQAPASLPALLAAAGWLLEPPRQILVQGEPGSAATQRLLREIRQRPLPRHVVLLVDAASRQELAARSPLIAALPEDVGEGALAYVCENFSCHLPTADPAVLARLLSSPPATDP